MGGMGEKEKYKMYRIVDESECKRYRSDCSHVLKKTCALLKEKCINIFNSVSVICSCFNFCLNLKLCLVGAC